MTALIISPIAVTLLGAAACLVLWNHPRLHQVIATASAAALLVVSIVLLLTVSADGIQVAEVAGWEAPLGIVLVADLLSAIMVCLAGIIGLAVVIYSISSTAEEHVKVGFYPLVLFLLAGVSGAFLTGDFFNLFVWFEVMLMASFVLLAVEGGRLQMEGALKYVTLNFFSSLIFLTALGLLYATAGTLNFASLSLAVRDTDNAGLYTTLGMLFLLSFGIKAALFPFFFWLPSSYHTPPVAVSALFAGLLTKVGVYALLRVFTLLFTSDVSFTHTVILILSALTMFAGVLGAMAHNHFRRILSFHIVSQIGYMTMGLGMFTLLGLAGAIFYVIHHIIVKTNLFLVSGIVSSLRGTEELKVLGGLQARTVLAVCFLVPAMSLAGIPPLSGFFAKLSLVNAGISNGDYWIVGVALFVGFLTLYSMTKIWNEVFAKQAPDPPPEITPQTEVMSPWRLVPVISLACLTVAMGLGAGPMLELSTRAAEQLLDSSEYVTAVLGQEAGE